MLSVVATPLTDLTESAQSLVNVTLLQYAMPGRRRGRCPSIATKRSAAVIDKPSLAKRLRVPPRAKNIEEHGSISAIAAALEPF